MQIPFYRVKLEEEDIQKVEEVLRSGWIGQGPQVEQFEKEFAEYVGASEAVALSSCTAGLFLALRALGIGPGDEVITSPLTFAATANVIENTGAKPVFVDVDPVTCNIDPVSVKAAVTPRTKAIIPVHLYGRPCEMDRIMEIASKHNLMVIEDAAHALGAAYKGKPIGSIGHVTSFSFYATKNLTTAEGGMLTTDDPDLANKIRILRLHGISRDAWKRYTHSSPVHYQVVMPGFKFNMTDIQAALGRNQLKRFHEIQTRRRRLWNMYRERLKNINGIRLPLEEEKGIVHAYHLFAVLIEHERITRDEIMNQLAEMGVSTSVHFHALHLQPYYREKYGYKPGDFPHAEHISTRTLSLPFFPSMSEDELEYVCECLKKILT